jgi:hypothetical protein
MADHRKTTPLLDLPWEIVERVLEELLISGSGAITIRTHILADYSSKLISCWKNNSASLPEPELAPNLRQPYWPLMNRRINSLNPLAEFAKPSHRACILATCRLLRIEGQKILYGCNKFRFEHIATMDKFFIGIGAQNESMIRMLQFHDDQCFLWRQVRESIISRQSRLQSLDFLEMSSKVSKTRGSFPMTGRVSISLAFQTNTDLESTQLKPPPADPENPAPKCQQFKLQVFNVKARLTPLYDLWTKESAGSIPTPESDFCIDPEGEVIIERDWDIAATPSGTSLMLDVPDSLADTLGVGFTDQLYWLQNSFKSRVSPPVASVIAMQPNTPPMALEHIWDAMIPIGPDQPDNQPVRQIFVIKDQHVRSWMAFIRAFHASPDFPKWWEMGKNVFCAVAENF